MGGNRSFTSLRVGNKVDVVQVPAMCNVTVLEFFIENARAEEFDGKRVLEVGSRYVNGSVRPFVERFLHPREYIGIDVEPGRYVDLILPAEKMLGYFGSDAFDVVISTEVLEHIWDWKKVISNMKNVVNPGRFMYITTRSINFPLHGYPYDFWRFELEDMKNIFSDCKILVLDKDFSAPGVFIKVKKPNKFVEKDLSHYELYSVVANKRVNKISDEDFRNLYYRRILKKRVKKRMMHFVSKIGKLVFSKA